MRRVWGSFSLSPGRCLPSHPPSLPFFQRLTESAPWARRCVHGLPVVWEHRVSVDCPRPLWGVLPHPERGPSQGFTGSVEGHTCFWFFRTALPAGGRLVCDNCVTQGKALTRPVPFPSEMRKLGSSIPSGPQNFKLPPRSDWL